MRMQDFSLSVLGTDLAQTLGAAVLGVLLLGFYRHGRQPYLLHWGLSWIAAFLYATIISGEPAAAGSVLAVGMELALGITAALHAGFLLLGAWEMATRRRLGSATEAVLLGGLLVVGAFTGSDFAQRILVDTPAVGGISPFRAGLGALAFTSAGVLVWRSRRERNAGVRLMGAAAVLYGLQHGQYLGLAVIYGATANVLAYVTWLGVVDVLLQWLMGFGMAAALVEAERAEHAANAAELEFHAFHDALTGLPNRHLLVNRLELALAQSRRDPQARLALVFVDIDRLKLINDSLGHQAGDDLIAEVASRLRKATRQGDTVARLSGDEFALLFPGTGSPGAATIADKLLVALREPITLHGREIFPTASLGISVYPDDAVDARALIRAADTAMYQAKEASRDSFRFYSAEMNARATERLALENALRKALPHDELRIHYQPIVSAVSGQIRKVEALLRWQHPERGLLPAGRFLDIAESTGLIVPMGYWALEHAMGQVCDWHARGRPDLTLAMNISPRHLLDPQLVARIDDTLARTGFRPDRLEIEITESMAVSNPERASAIVHDLRSRGIRVAMDDFGAGHSSLTYLKQFRVDCLKIDRIFISGTASDAHDRAIIATLIELSHILDLEVVAEGVETEAELTFLRDHGCDLIQGFLLARPAPAEALEDPLGVLPDTAGVTRAVTAGRPPAG
jgi:diguanylate cyclase (GGDEF)-like protein